MHVPVVHRAVRPALRARDHELAHELAVADPIDPDLPVLPALQQSFPCASSSNTTYCPSQVNSRRVPEVHGRVSTEPLERMGRVRVGRIGDVPELTLGLARGRRPVDRQEHGDVVAAGAPGIRWRVDVRLGDHARASVSSSGTRTIEIFSNGGLAARTCARRVRRDVEQDAVVREVRDQRVRVRAAIACTRPSAAGAGPGCRGRRCGSLRSTPPARGRVARPVGAADHVARSSAACRSKGTGELPVVLPKSETSFCGPRHGKYVSSCVRVRVEDPEAVVVAGDHDVAPERDVRVRPPGRRVVEAVVEPHVRASSSPTRTGPPTRLATIASRSTSRRGVFTPLGC